MADDLRADYGDENIIRILGWEDNMSHFARDYPDDWEAREVAFTDDQIRERIRALVEACEEGEDG